ncbi:MAG: glycosyltransferase [Salibacteraceae bacterium]|nr:glycosyltransferase [Salibacteraceae bacterium]
MKISIITATYNSAATLQKTFDSVAAQSHDDIEYIVIDGASKDETIELIKKNESIISKWVSEPDKGIYDAINKGIELATGHIIGLMHSDDFFADNQVLENVASAFQEGTDCIYGDLNYVDRDHPERIIRKWQSQDYNASLFYKGWMPAHPTFYLRAEHYKELGKYNLNFRISADYELMLRMLLKNNLSSRYLPIVLVNMRVGGESNVTLKNRWLANQEDVKAWHLNNLKPKFYTRWAKPLSKLKQFF